MHCQWDASASTMLAGCKVSCEVHPPLKASPYCYFSPVSPLYLLHFPPLSWLGALCLPHPPPQLELGEPQWVNCDIRSFRLDLLGQFGVIMADPPWDIHMELPYGTMADDEMRTLNVPVRGGTGRCARSTCR